MNHFLKKFLIVFFSLMLVGGGLAYGMVRIILSNPQDPNKIFMAIGLFLIIFIPLLIGSVWYLIKSVSGYSKKEKQLLATGTRASAEILDIQETGVVINRIHPVVKLTLKLPVSFSGKPVEAQAQTMVSLVNMPRRGDSVQVAYDPSNPSDLVVIR